ncbi:MAG TPA: hypothetical protein VGN72_19220 [Tepidisphaeraceae bacterium]|nr:hypothetical protein [Tepidisphaeraceae bacterium]
MTNRTIVSFAGDAIHINGQPTYAGRTYNGHKIEGLLLNVRLVQATYHDENPETQSWWRYPDGTDFDPDRNTDQFLKMLPEWRAQGMLGFTINLQGGSPRGYSTDQPWRNSAFTPTGELKAPYMARIARVIDAADELGMAVILGYFYFGQTRHFIDEAAIERAVDNATDWLLARGDGHVLVEIANECDHWDYPPIIKPPRAVELIKRVQQRSAGKLRTPAGRLLASTSFLGQAIPSDDVVGAADYLLIHGNGTKNPDAFRQQIRGTRAHPAYRGQPIVCNEDDHFDFGNPDNNFLVAIGEYCSWGYFDYRFAGEAWVEGYQSVPTDWSTNSERKKGFFKLLSTITRS